jgi:hypothetical protein
MLLRWGCVKTSEFTVICHTERSEESNLHPFIDPSPLRRIRMTNYNLLRQPHLHQVFRKQLICNQTIIHYG